MKRSGIVLLMTAVILGCVQRKARDPNGFDKTKIIAACDQMIEEFQASLKQELMTALTEGGPVNAISICNVRAPVIADSFSSMPGIDIRRVSLKQRGRHHSPDSFEVAVLERFLAAGASEPQTFSQVVFDSAEVKRFRYLKEIKIGQLCLNCHGNPDGFSPHLKKTLAEYYPGDRAVGYEVGSSRGAFSVVVRYPEAKETIDAILSEQGK